VVRHVGSISGVAAHENKYIATAGDDGPVILWEKTTGESVNSSVHDHLVARRLRAAITPLLIAGAMATALVVASSTTSAPVTENLCTSGNVHTMGANANTVAAALAPARPVAVQIPVNMCLHPCDALYQSRTELCGSKASLCMSEAADRHADCLSANK
jgi:hypothetical protein